ncbi:hypothetical protein BJV82DRAFT_285574 [Fennellomyces sp. T-0311]|nr:hypothetical protein BJV82DRAFT_285574 [Fennellomyces sp. T-0311]
MIRQMNPERRVLTICHGLKHLKSKQIANLLTILRLQRKRATAMELEAEAFITSYNQRLTDSVLHCEWTQFYNEVTGASSSPNGNRDTAINAATITARKVQYAWALHDFYEAESSSTGPSESLRKSVDRLERALRRDGILQQRWERDDDEYKVAVRQGWKREQEAAKSQLKLLIIGRTMLKYQLFRVTQLRHKTSVRSSQAIQNVKETEEPLRKRYNTACEKLEKPELNAPSYDTICDLKHSFWSIATHGVDFHVLE